MTKENIYQMKERHAKEIEKLQAECPHKRATKWIEEHWAPGHGTGRLVKMCHQCGIVVKSKNMLEYGKETDKP